MIDHAAGIERGSEGKRIGAGLMSWPALVFLIVDRVLWFAVFWLCLRVLVP